jgi:competence protein ComEA
MSPANRVGRAAAAIAVAAVLWASPLVATIPAQATQIVFPEGDGKSEFVDSCGGCHDLVASVAKRHTVKEWDAVITAMKARGVTAPDAELKQIAAYLSRHFGLVNVNKAGADELKQVLGITAHDAEAIVAHRDNHGAFNSLDDLKAIPGIDAEAIEREKASVVFIGT